MIFILFYCFLEGLKEGVGEAPPTTASKNHTELVNLEQMGDFPAEQTTPSGKGLI